MLPTQHRSRVFPSWVPPPIRTLLLPVYRSRGWQAFAVLLLLFLMSRYKVSRRERYFESHLVQHRVQLREFEILLANQSTLIDDVAKGVTIASDAASRHGESSGRQGEGLCRAALPQEDVRKLRQNNRHKMAVIVPHRDRNAMLDAFLPALHSFLKAQGREFTIFVLEQSPALRFNRGMLLNAGVQLLAGSSYDYFVFHDVDTTPTEVGGLPYDYPYGKAPLHLTPPGIHPKVRYKDFFGGISAWNQEQLQAVNGYGNRYWGWGREDDNMRERLKRAGMWPPDKPSVPKRSARYYFRHTEHPKALEVRVKNDTSGSPVIFEIYPDEPYGDTLIISSQPGQLDDYATGLGDVKFWVREVVPIESIAVKYIVELYCNTALEPWCQP